MRNENPVLRSEPLILAMSLTTLVACGGGGGGSSDPAPDVPVPDAAVGGLWAGTVTDNVFNDPQFFLGVSTDDGRFRFLSADTLGQFVGTFDTTGTSLTGSGVGIAPVGMYERGSSLATVARSWISRDEFGNPIGSITIDSEGRMDAQDAAGCLYSGDVSIINPSYNAYNLTITVSSCGQLDGAYSGLAVVADDVATDDLLIYSVDNASWFIIAEAHK